MDPVAIEGDMFVVKICWSERSKLMFPLGSLKHYFKFYIYFHATYVFLM